MSNELMLIIIFGLIFIGIALCIISAFVDNRIFLWFGIPCVLLPVIVVVFGGLIAWNKS